MKRICFVFLFTATAALAESLFPGVKAIMTPEEQRNSGLDQLTANQLALIDTAILRYYAGIAFGQRPYDIFGIQAYKETGYILFTGLNLNLYKGINCRVGYSYGTETPKFIKHGLSCGLTVKF